MNNIPSLVQTMAWRRPSDKPLSEPMMVNLLTHIWVTRPEWVNWEVFKIFNQNFTLSSFWRTQFKRVSTNLAGDRRLPKAMLIQFIVAYIWVTRSQWVNWRGWLREQRSLWRVVDLPPVTCGLVICLYLSSSNTSLSCCMLLAHCRAECLERNVFTFYIHFPLDFFLLSFFFFLFFS